MRELNSVELIGYSALLQRATALSTFARLTLATRELLEELLPPAPEAHDASTGSRVEYMEVKGDRRVSARMPPSEQIINGVLHVKRGVLPAVVINESTGGFLISTPCDSRIKVGQTLLLNNSAGFWTVEVVHIRSNERGMRIGLKRIREAEPPRRRIGFPALVVLFAIALSALLILRYA